MRALKKILFDAYGGFADKRIKDLDKSSRFIIDDRNNSDIGADKKLLSYFCMIFAEVTSNEALSINFIGNVPVGKDVKKWLKLNSCEIQTPAYQSSLSIEVERGHQEILSDLARAIERIVAPGAPRYEIKSYKYVCPRTAKSLRRIKRILDQAWAKPLPPDLKGLLF